MNSGDLQNGIGLMGIGIVLALIGQLILLTTNSLTDKEQLNVLSSVPKDSKLGFLFLVAFGVVKVSMGVGYLVYVLAGLFVVSPFYDLYRTISFIRICNLSYKHYYYVAFFLRQSGFSAVFLGLMIRALKNVIFF